MENSYKAIYRELSRLDHRREVIGTIDIFEGKPSLVKSS
jgi:hypothetical protein